MVNGSFTKYGLIEDSNMPLLQEAVFNSCFLPRLQLLRVKVTNAAKACISGNSDQEGNLKWNTMQKVFILNSDAQGFLHSL